MEPINVAGSAVHYASDVIVAAVARGRSAAGAAPRSGDTRKSAGAYVEMSVLAGSAHRWRQSHHGSRTITITLAEVFSWKN